MKKLLLGLTSFNTWILVGLLLLSFESWYLFYKNGLNLAYSDSMSHLNLSRLIIDNLEPGFAQIGGVWLPLTHVLPLLLIWNNWAWHSGFAGSFFSMLAYILSAWGIYQICRLLTKNRLASLIGGLVFALNLNLLYLQSTALTEPVYLLFFIYSALFFIKWIYSHQSKYLFALGLCGFLQVLTRYDGWFVVGIEGILVLSFELYKRKNFTEFLGKLVVFSFPIIFGMGVWLLWNALIFKDPLFFALGPYSARAQQLLIEHSSGLLTKGNFELSFIAYSAAIWENIGVYISLLGLCSISVFMLSKKLTLGLIPKLLILVMLMSPIIFNILALFLGFSILNLPLLNWNPSDNPAGNWFNVRYGILALPFFAILIGVYASLPRAFALFAIAIILFQTFVTFNEGLITIIDGTRGSSAFRYQDVSKFLSTNIGPQDKVLLSLSYFNPVAFKAGIDLKQIIHEGVSKKWFRALENPKKYVSWIVVSNGDSADPVYKALFKDSNQGFLSDYQLVYKSEKSNVYKIKTKLSKLETGIK